MWDRDLGFVKFAASYSKCMRIWCCLWFNEEDEEAREGDNRSNSMKEINFFENYGLPDDAIGNDDDPLVGTDTTLSLAVNGREREDQLRWFDEMARAVSAGGFSPWSNTAPRTSRRSDGESSSASAVVAAGLGSAAEDSRDSHHKRAKVLSNFE